MCLSLCVRSYENRALFPPLKMSKNIDLLFEHIGLLRISLTLSLSFCIDRGAVLLLSSQPVCMSQGYACCRYVVRFSFLEQTPVAQVLLPQFVPL